MPLDTTSFEIYQYMKVNMWKKVKWKLSVDDSTATLQ